jgi:hypothetical protein
VRVDIGLVSRGEQQLARARLEIERLGRIDQEGPAVHALRRIEQRRRSPLGNETQRRCARHDAHLVAPRSGRIDHHRGLESVLAGANAPAAARSLEARQPRVADHLASARLEQP